MWKLIRKDVEFNLTFEPKEFFVDFEKSMFNIMPHVGRHFKHYAPRWAPLLPLCPTLGATFNIMAHVGRHF
jgi:hypothetical protein